MYLSLTEEEEEGGGQDRLPADEDSLNKISSGILTHPFFFLLFTHPHSQTPKKKKNK